MNLVLSGPIDDNLRNEVAASVKPRNVVRLHAKAYRFEGADDSAQMRIRIATMCDASRVDHAYVEEGKRFSDFKLLAMDMDSTLITIECIDEIADFAGKKKEVAAITEAAMRGEIPDFAESLRRRVALLAGLPVGTLERVYKERLMLSPGGLELITEARRHNMHTMLVSGGFTYFSDRLAKALSIDEAYANTLVVKDGRLSGKVVEPIFDGIAKRDRVKSSLVTLHCRFGDALVIGDGANDIPMMSLTSNSVAYKAKPHTTGAANYAIRYTTLETVLDLF